MSLLNTAQDIAALGLTQEAFNALPDSTKAMLIAGVQASKAQAESEFRKLFSIAFTSNATWQQEQKSIAYLVNKEDRINEIVRVIKMGLELGSGFEVCLTQLVGPNGDFIKFDPKLNKGLIPKTARPE